MSFQEVKMNKQIIGLDEQLIKLGYFSDHIPPCFHTEKLYENYKSLKSSCEIRESESLSITIAKNDNHRRTIKIPNPEQQLKLFDYLLENIDQIEELLNTNKHTLANPTKREVLTYDELHFFDIPLLKDRYKIRSSYLHSLGIKMRKSMGYKFLYRLDLSNFYDSIYTHSIEWAIIGKESAKENLRNKSYKGNLGEKLDTYVRNTNNKETFGIPTGPFSSRIISELLLNKVDEDIDKMTEEIDFKFVHYVDDYEFYFRNEADFKRVIHKIRKVFENYRLKINENKSDLYSYPFHNVKDLKEQFSYYIYKFKKNKTKHDVRLLFFKADEFNLQGEKGAYKYLYKQLEKIDLSFAWEDVEPFLINHLLIKPALAQFIIKIILNHSHLISERLKMELKNNLFISIENQMDNEAQWLFWILKKLKFNFTATQISKLLFSTSDDILRIMLIDTAHQQKKIKTKSVQKALNSVIEEIGYSSLRSERWLLIYEWVFNKWYNYKKIEEKVDEVSFFKALRKRKVNFYSF